jgi:hypothetical protein
VGIGLLPSVNKLAEHRQPCAGYLALSST